MSNRYHTLRQHKKRPVKGIKLPRRPKVFRTAETAESWAKSHNMTGYKIEKIAEKRFKLRR